MFSVIVHANSFLWGLVRQPLNEESQLFFLRKELVKVKCSYNLSINKPKGQYIIVFSV